MKKIRNTIILLLLLILMSSLGYNNIRAAEFDKNENTIEVAYNYPTKPNTPEWLLLDTLDKKLQVCNIPNDILKRLSTEALLDTILDYPLLVNAYVYNSLEQGFDVVRQQFNGIDELFQRKDAGEIIYKKYKDISIQTQLPLINWDNMDKYAFLERLLVQDEIYPLLESKYTSEISSLITSKIVQKAMNSDIYGITANKDILNIILEDNPSLYSYIYATVFTPKGSVVSVMTRDEILTQGEKDMINLKISNSYPKATRLREPSYLYNCHSYAWYSQSPNNNYWMNNPSSYMRDGSYSQLSSPQINCKAYYTGGDHSAIVTNLSSGIRCTSKWGEAGLYEHAIGDSPYISSNIQFYK